jgi:tetratricopeptide (TPR) repeat protein
MSKRRRLDEAAFAIAEIYKKQGNFEVAEEFYKKAAEAGHVQAQRYLSRTSRQSSERIKWLEKLAKINDTEAVYQLACHYEQQHVDFFSCEKVQRTFTCAANLGHPKAQVWLGNWYSHKLFFRCLRCKKNRENSRKDMPTAIKWFHQAAERKSSEAIETLALYYFEDKSLWKQSNEWFYQYFKYVHKSALFFKKFYDYMQKWIATFEKPDSLLDTLDFIYINICEPRITMLLEVFVSHHATQLLEEKKRKNQVWSTEVSRFFYSDLVDLILSWLQPFEVIQTALLLTQKPSL